MRYYEAIGNEERSVCMKKKPSLLQMLLWSFVLVLFVSCRSNEDIPLPKQTETNAQPTPVELKFTESTNLKWDTVKTGDMKPVVKPFILSALPSEPLKISLYDSLPAIPSTNRSEVKFSLGSLPEKDLDIRLLKSKPIPFKTSVITISNKVKVKPTSQANQTISIYDLSVAQGLPTSVIATVYKDRSGMIWMGGTDGIYRYDGQYVETVVRNSASAIVGICEDNNGHIWYVQNGGIGVIDMQAGTVKYSQELSAERDNLCKITKTHNGNLWFYNENDSAMAIIDPQTFTYKSTNEKGLFKRIKAYQAVEDNEHRMWITTYFLGVHIVDPATGKVKVLKISDYFKNAVAAALAKDDKGNIWVTTVDGGIYEIDLQKEVLRMHYAGDKAVQFVFNAAFDHKNRLWATTPGGVMVVDAINKGIKWVRTGEGLSSNVTYGLMIEDNSKIWVSTPQGIQIIDQQGDPSYYLSGTSIISMLEDENQHLWVGTRQGVRILDFKKKVMRTLNFSNEIGNNFIQSFLKTPDEMIITTNGGISIINLTKNTISYLGKKQGLVNDTVYVSLKDKAGNLWLSGPTNGIDKIDASGKLILHTDRVKGLNDLNIQDIKEDNSGLIWIATRKGGVNVYDPASGKIKYLNSLPGLQGVCNKMLLKDNYGRIWIGTDKGVYVADNKEATITHISTSNGLVNNTILSLLPYNGSVVAATTNKASIITAPIPYYARQTNENKKGQWKIETLNNSYGLKRKNNSAWNTDAITASGNYLWGDIGVSVVDGIKPEKVNEAVQITRLSIMTKNYHFTNSYPYKTGDTLFAPDTFYINGQQPTAASQPAAAGLKWDSVSGPFNMPVNLNIPYHQNYLQFQFSKIGVSSVDTSWYMYVLQGIDKKWSEPTSNNFTENYLNLPPGAYTFKVSSKGVDGQWTPPIAFSFTITPPWYKSWWAYTLLTLIALGTLRAYIVYRSKRLQRENKLLEEKVAQRTEELNNSLENLKQTQAQLVQSEKMASLGELTAGIAHEIQNPLNFVNNFSEVSKELVEEMEEALANNDQEEAIAIASDIKGNLEKIAHHGKRADSIVKGMLQHSRSSTGKKEPTDINALADEYLRLSYHGLRAKDKTFNARMETSFDENVGKADVLPQDFGRVLLNLFNNAFYAVNEKKKQFGGTFDPMVSVSTKRQNDRIEIVVKDNGIGIPQQVIDKIFQPFFTTKPTGEGTGLGLSLSYDIITKSHGGELQVETEEGKGSVFHIWLPV